MAAAYGHPPRALAAFALALGSPEISKRAWTEYVIWFATSPGESYELKSGVGCWFETATPPMLERRVSAKLDGDSIFARPIGRTKRRRQITART